MTDESEVIKRPRCKQHGRWREQGRGEKQGKRSGERREERKTDQRGTQRRGSE